MASKEFLLTLMTLNCENKTGKVEGKYEMIKDIVKNEQPDIIFYQELSSKEKWTNIIKEKNYYSIQSNTDSQAKEGASKRYNGIVVKKQNSFIPEKSPRKIQELMSGRYALLDLLLTSEPEKQKRILLVSYHGINNEPVNKPKKLVELINIIKEIVSDKKKNYVGFIIGGDFNMGPEDAQKCVGPMVYDYKCHPDRPDVIDFFISAGVSLCGVQVKSLLHASGRDAVPDKSVLDHLPVLAWFNHKQLETRETAVFSLESTNSHQPDALNEEPNEETDDEENPEGDQPIEDPILKAINEMERKYAKLNAKINAIDLEINEMSSRLRKLEIEKEGSVVDSASPEDVLRWRKEQLQDWLDIVQLFLEQPGDTDIEPLTQLIEPLKQMIGSHSDLRRDQAEAFKTDCLEKSRPLLEKFAECIEKL